ncbi:MAG: hypothetical protein KDA84_02450, partial [Planctomycetaceae bacterium]|nr:hypothetical protein [Planctomycetaceae bacterium]
MSGSISLHELHQRLLADDPTVPAEIATKLFNSLCDDLRRKFPGRQFHDLVNHATEDALISYFKQPEQYDPAKSDLQAYLRMSALGDLRNALRSERNRQEKFQTGVELSQFAGKEVTEGDDSLTTLQTKELREEIRQLFP